MKQRQNLWRKLGGYCILMAVFILVMAAATLVTRQQLLENARESSFATLDNCSLSEEKELETYQTILTLCTNFLDEKEQEGASIQEIKSGLYPYLDGFYDLYDGDEVVSYGIVQGVVISNDPARENYVDQSYDYTKTAWYQGAQDRAGKLYITRAYYDPLTGETTVTLSKRAAHSDSVLAFDLFFDTYHGEGRSLELPENGDYFLCDQSGVVLYSQTDLYTSRADIQGFVDEMLPQLTDTDQGGCLESYTDAAGVKRSAYQTTLSNGWQILMTVPRENALGNLRAIYWAIGAALLCGVLIIAAMGSRDYRRETVARRLRKEHQTAASTAQRTQLAMNSAMQAYRVVCYVDLSADRFQILFPEERQEEEQRDFEEYTKEAIDLGRLKSEDPAGLRHFLALDTIRQALTDRDYVELRCYHQGPEGKDENCLLTITAAQREKGVPVSVTIAVRSIENVLRQEEAQRELLTLALQRAEAASHAKTDFLSNMSHDIRTPMNAILGMTAIAGMNLDDKEKVQDALHKIDLSGKHLLGLLNGVLDMSKLESGHTRLVEAPFSLKQTLESVCTLIQPEADAKEQTLILDAETLRHPEVVGDDRRLQQILLNLLTNAVRFTPKGGTITVEAQEEPGVLSGRREYRFAVIDTGVGMEKDFLDRVFEPFTRASDTRITKADSTGLGLPIARNIAQMMGGDIQAESTVGKGSRFTVHLSLKQGKGETGSDAQTLPKILSDFQSQDYTGRRILLVEDNELNIEVAGELLESVGLSVDYAYNGRQGLEKVAQSKPGTYDLVLMDIQMPEMNGYEATAAIRKLDRPDAQTLPIVAMTADAFAEDAQRAREAGMNGHMAKPVDLGKLEKVLAEWIR